MKSQIKIEYKTRISWLLYTPLQDKTFIWKESVVRRSCNLNLLNYNTDRNVTQFVDEHYTNFFISYINLSTSISKHSETLIDNLLYNKIIPNWIAGNITTGISNNLIQFFIEPSTFSKNNKKAICFEQFNKENFKNEIYNINWRNY